MLNQPITAEDLGAAVAGFSIGLAAVLLSPRYQTPAEVLEALANETDTMAESMQEPAKSALKLTAELLMISEHDPKALRR